LDEFWESGFAWLAVWQDSAWPTPLAILALLRGL
jgi:hypothetical protein